MANELDSILDTLRSKGYDSVTRIYDWSEEADGTVPLSKEQRREPQTGWRRFLPRIENEADPELVPDDLRSVVEEHGWTVQPLGREDESAYIIISKDGV
ncbi:hypothetical protein [Halococcus sp. IIIV-5B]|uniref:hypothetical protein n=1 Tax=Halococcus sp. IIIV-5B TaxID=2321230 RepID=UPI001F3A5813|nr:hypothetical protein [Halococcus sp. IIIV-5B]